MQTLSSLSPPPSGPLRSVGSAPAALGSLRTWAALILPLRASWRNVTVSPCARAALSPSPLSSSSIIITITTITIITMFKTYYYHTSTIISIIISIIIISCILPSCVKRAQKPDTTHAHVKDHVHTQTEYNLDTPWTTHRACTAHATRTRRTAYAAYKAWCKPQTDYKLHEEEQGDCIPHVRSIPVKRERRIIARPSLPESSTEHRQCAQDVEQGLHIYIERERY